MSRPIASSLIALLVLCLAPADGNGQSPTHDAHHDQTSALMTSGAHVRVKLRGEQAWTGRLVSLAGDSMLVRSTLGIDTTLVRVSQATQVAVSAGLRRSRHLVRNTAIAVAIGGGLGWVIGGAMQSGGCSETGTCFDGLECLLCMAYNSPPPAPPIRDRAVAGAVVGGLAAGAVALLVSRHRSEDWRPVSINPRGTAVRLSARGASVAIAF